MSGSYIDEIDDMVGRLAATDIDGCITGSCLTGGDFDSWLTKPDVDVFTYSPYAMVHALDVLEYKLGLVPGGEGIMSERGEGWKLDKVRISGRGSHDLATVKMTDGIVTVNVSNRKWERSAMDVIARFDMSIVLKAIDIPSGSEIDFTDVAAKSDVARIVGHHGGDPNVAVPNPFRTFDGTTWNASKWLRQWDRVIKYDSRGFDTLPMARFYRHMIKEVIDGGCLFKTEASQQAYEEFVAEFKGLGDEIEAWIEERE